jgi:hypothetical protein
MSQYILRITVTTRTTTTTYTPLTEWHVLFEDLIRNYIQNNLHICFYTSKSTKTLEVITQKLTTGTLPPAEMNTRRLKYATHNIGKRQSYILY